MTILGIDAGTTRFKTANLTASGDPQILTNRIGETFTPSVVFFSEDGSVLVGTEAVNASLADPSRAVYDWKVNMGTDEVLYSDGRKSYTAKDILIILLKNVKMDAESKTGESVNDVIITVPANYSNIQKQQTSEAGKEAGMNVILMPHEPTAGALGNKIYKLKNATALMYDLGGGTFDVSIIKVKGNLSEVLATSGIQKLGGRDFNNRIKDYILDEFETQNKYRPTVEEYAVFYQDLNKQIEHLKISLSSQKQSNVVLQNNGDVLTLTITRDQFENLVKDLVEQSIEQTEKTLKDAGLKWTDIDAIYPIGGGSMMPIVTRMLEEASGKKVTRNCEAHCAAALGAVTAGRIEYERVGKTCQVGSQKLPPIGFFTRDILSCSMGVSALDEDGREVCCEILGKDIPIPSIITRNFQLAEVNQQNVRIQVLQGRDGERAKKCVLLGHFDLKGLPPSSDLGSRIEITYDLDANGMLTASARDLVGGKKAEFQLDYSNSQN